MAHRYSLRMLVLTVLGVMLTFSASAQINQDLLREAIDSAVERVKPAVVRIQVVSTRYRDGRELKYQSSGSGVIISPEGHIVTNHHVAGDATRLMCTLASKEELEAELIGRDPMTDTAVIKLIHDGSRTFPTAGFGDSSVVRVGDPVLAMGSPMALSQSVTLGIVSNAELVMPEWLGRRGQVQQDGENVGSLVRWIAHDAQIAAGNSGGPLVNINGEVIGINEIGVGGLGGAIPSNLVNTVSQALITDGQVRRAWLGVSVQPRLKHGTAEKGVLLSSVLEGAPADEAGLQAGDIIIRIKDTDVDAQFTEELPEFNQMVADLPIGEPIPIKYLRNGEEHQAEATLIERERAFPQQHELPEWGITARNLSYLLSREMQRDSTDGVVITSIRSGGPVGDARPRIESDDVIVKVGGERITSLADLRAATESIIEGQEDPVPTVVTYERDAQRFMTVVRVGLRELDDPSREVRRAWLPVQTQVITRDISEELGEPDLTGFIITQVFSGTTAEEAGLEVGDFIVAVDGEPMLASLPEEADDLAQLIRQYRIGAEVELEILRDGERKTIEVEFAQSPRQRREMNRYRDARFEFTVRDITFFDRAERQWDEERIGVMVEEVQSGGWADVALMESGDLILEIDGEPIPEVEKLRTVLDELEEVRSDSVVFKVLRGIHTTFLEVEPKWETLDDE